MKPIVEPSLIEERWRELVRHSFSDGDHVAECDEFRGVIADPGLDYLEKTTRIRELRGIESCTPSPLERALEQRDRALFQHCLIAGANNPSRELSALFCAALRLKIDEVPYEDILEVLGEMKDPEILPCLTEMIWWRPEDDEFHQIAVKALQAIALIPGPEAGEVNR